ncbi:hypothetical protein ACWOAH_03340 [Vagococcus vulneris]|uniref:GOLD domain-containing protein n=1 Tax=Vagococcus vulneris TaxID=1977869 RepID=A0A429ZXA9_9ENTE|nr:hypothetical protein [Vagococcus vulneris]RST98529.1 hypothetical protein CBF37_07070 [Vagococcus vulneris]
MNAKIIKILGIISLLVVLSSCTLRREFNGSRTGNDDQFIMSYDILNTKDSQELTFKKSEKIISDIDNKSGELTVEFLNKNEEILFKKNYNKDKDRFTFEVPKDGKYVISVTGKNAKGKVSFIKE